MLIEAMIAITLILAGLLGVFSILSQSLGLHKVAADQYVGVNLAAEGVEVTRNIVDANFLSGSPWNDSIHEGKSEVQYNSTNFVPSDDLPEPRRLWFDPVTGTYQYSSAGYLSKFSRTIEIEMVDIEGVYDQMNVKSIVRWRNKGTDFEVNLEDRFYNWRD